MQFFHFLLVNIMIIRFVIENESTLVIIACLLCLFLLEGKYTHSFRMPLDFVMVNSFKLSFLLFSLHPVLILSLNFINIFIDHSLIYIFVGRGHHFVYFLLFSIKQYLVAFLEICFTYLPNLKDLELISGKDDYFAKDVFSEFILILFSKLHLVWWMGLTVSVAVLTFSNWSHI